MRFRNFSIRYKIFIPLLLTALCTITVMGVVGYHSSKNALEQAAYNQLISLREARKYAIEHFFDELQAKMVALSERYTTIEAMKDFQRGFMSLSQGAKSVDRQALIKYYHTSWIEPLKKNGFTPPSAESYVDNLSPEGLVLQYHYLALNKFPAGEKEQLFTSNALPKYDPVHQLYHPRFSNYLKYFRFDDLLLIDNSGNIVYSTGKQTDIGSNLKTGAFSNSSFAKAVTESMENLDIGTVRIVDFSSYEPAYGYPVLFALTPIAEKGKKIGLLALQVPDRLIDEIMTGGNRWKESGLGTSGETYLIGHDHLLRSNSRFLSEDKKSFFESLRNRSSGENEEGFIYMDKLNTGVIRLSVHSQSVQSALQGNSGTEVSTDYRNIKVLSAYAPIDEKGIRWVVVSQMDQSEAFAPIDSLLKTYLWLIIGLVMGVFFLGLYVSRALSRPIVAIRDFMSQLAKGEFPDHTIPVISTDEIGQMNEAANDLLRGLQNTIHFAGMVENGNLDVPFTPLGEHDRVGHALLNMQLALQVAVALQRESFEEAMSQDDMLRQNAEELYTLNEELNTKQRDLIASNQALRASEAGLEQKIIERTNELTHKNTLLTDSINYAKNIQLAMLPTPAQLRKALPEHFIIYRPKDIVSGDFYWLSAHRNKLSIVCADCTGHGVPGAFMSIVGINTFNQIVREYGADLKPNLILDEVNQRICALLKQGYLIADADTHQQRDGMDVAYCFVDFKECKIRFAGAGRPLYYFSKGKLNVIKGDKLPIGASFLHYTDAAFTAHEVQLEKGDTIYMFSDGFSDQFDGLDKKKFSIKRVEQLLSEIQDLSLSEQGQTIENVLNEWQGNTPQTDDILIMGFRMQ